MRTGKKTVQLRLPMQLRDNEEVARDVRLLAEFEHRSLQGEIRHLLTIGLDQKIAQLGNETMSALRRSASPPVAITKVQESVSAPPVAARRTASRKEGVA